MIAPRGEDLAAPHPVGFVPFDRAGEADAAYRAGLAVCLGELQLSWQAREPQLRVLTAARQQLIQCSCLRRQQDQRAGHDRYRPRTGVEVVLVPDPARPTLRAMQSVTADVMRPPLDDPKAC